MAQEVAQPCDPAVQECANEELEEAVVTGLRASNQNNSITNNQEAGVDEGDIVKVAISQTESVEMTAKSGEVVERQVPLPLFDAAKEPEAEDKSEGDDQDE